ncbi:serine hydrolase domain-containing protein [Paenibacillus guangzhouensis]|uniref:serine hydrolase domain-containing protein n=1 Tax=Paenibacillus guangzhouensis TaxID=1473112 RepID=UPI001266B0CF|nr:serine hydrolase [Paenibacillus guangzhouensis]
MNIHEIITSYNNDYKPFSGTIRMIEQDQVIFEQGYGYANRSEQLKNEANTRFGIASGSKIFTAVTVLQLIEKGRLTLDTRLCDCGADRFPNFDPAITVRHLLTHSSGIPDYFDEEVMHDYSELWTDLPMYSMTTIAAFLPLFETKTMKFVPGERFSYSNAGYILLGWIVEQMTGMRFQDYVVQHVFRRCGMTDTAYDRLDQLPARTAVGYIEEGEVWRSNIYALPIVGGPDGGAFTTVHDMEKFWHALLNCELLSKAMTNEMLTPQIGVDAHIHYGYGVWMTVLHQEIFKYYVMGNDPGLEMTSSVYPKWSAQCHILSNNGSGAGAITRSIDESLYHRMK